MSHHENIRTLATEAFLAVWNDRMPVLWPNDGRIKPPEAPWARFTIITGNTSNACIGGYMRRTPIIFGVQIYLPMDRGTKAAYQAADALAALENQNYISPDTSTTLKTRTSTVIDGGVKDGYKIFAVTIDAIGDSELTAIEVSYLYRQPGGEFLYLQPDGISRYTSR